MSHIQPLSIVAVLVFMTLWAATARSQIAPPQTQPSPGTAPLVNADGSVTFKLYAPNAKVVSVGGDFAFKSVDMTRVDSGTWSATVGPLRPDLYSYNFTVDGLETIDPSNTTPKVGVIWFSSQFVVPGAEADFFAVKNVPHGQLHELWYESKALGETRRVIVYTPPGYDDDTTRKFPVLYLLHGYGDDETGWTNGGKANFVMDNLLAAGQAEPAVIVMPFGHPSRQWVIKLGRPRSSNRKIGAKAFAVPQMQAELIDSVIPLIEKTYRVRTDSGGRAIAGLSMGGNQALTIGLGNLSVFQYVAGFSSALVGDNKAVFASVLGQSDQANAQLKLLWFGIGDKDDLLKGDRELDGLLNQSGSNMSLSLRRATGTPGRCGGFIFAICCPNFSVKPIIDSTNAGRSYWQW